MEPTLLLVDDELKLLEVMENYLNREGFKTITAQNGNHALDLARTQNPSVVILDWMLPGMSGIDVCRELRRMGPVGIIMVTAKTEETDRVVGLEVGADDYLAKPFSLRELAARIRSLLRRMNVSFQFVQESDLIRGPFTISEEKCLVWKNDTEISLTPTENKMLITLCKKPGVVFSRLQLLRVAMDDDFQNYERTVDAHIRNLRKKIEDNPSEPVFIQTVYGFGYRFGDQK
ncbi:response regulator transcription factor [Paenibacillus cremeus]|uniref:Response regulator transcription factor n=1 Tax=Paenibacillus cremeus TaxID=2163881 RepID=A0A559K4K7_9BACL|nr:response regulator transcription factor [Paenibacillus cremeus]TVY07030.1 response regulator transcription factor [Paenibacillus cremeus]